MIRENFKSVALTEDEMSNLLIDCWSAMNKKSELQPGKYEYVDGQTGEVCYSGKPISVTITFKLVSCIIWFSCFIFVMP